MYLLVLVIIVKFNISVLSGFGDLVHLSPRCLDLSLWLPSTWMVIALSSWLVLSAAPVVMSPVTLGMGALNLIGGLCSPMLYHFNKIKYFIHTRKGNFPCSTSRKRCNKKKFEELKKQN